MLSSIEFQSCEGCLCIFIYSVFLKALSHEVVSPHGLFCGMFAFSLITGVLALTGGQGAGYFPEQALSLLFLPPLDCGYY